jgi:hypothetical protein
VESLQPTDDHESRARYWCLLARLRLAGNAFREARAALEQARPPAAAASRSKRSCGDGKPSSRAVSAICRPSNATCEPGLPPRAAHLPVCAIKLRMALLEALLDSRSLGRARTVAARLAALARRSMPPLAKSQIERVLARLNAPAGDKAAGVATAAHEAVAPFDANATAGLKDLDALRELLSTAHHEDERAASHAAALVRKHTGRRCRRPRLGRWRAAVLASAGTPPGVVARRACGAGIAIGPERAGNGVEAAVPIRFLSHLTGALSIRWTVDGPPHAERAMAFAAAAGAACAPVVYVLLERRSVVGPGDAELDLIGVSAGIEEVRRAVRRAASAPFTVLVEGERVR